MSGEASAVTGASPNLSLSWQVSNCKRNVLHRQGNGYAVCMLGKHEAGRSIWWLNAGNCNQQETTFCGACQTHRWLSTSAHSSTQRSLNRQSQPTTCSCLLACMQNVSSSSVAARLSGATYSSTGADGRHQAHAAGKQISSKAGSHAAGKHTTAWQLNAVLLTVYLPRQRAHSGQFSSKRPSTSLRASMERSYYPPLSDAAPNTVAAAHAQFLG
jgi:hypothetical protein